jgi:NADH-quinone oxidoreductase subunit C
MQFLSLEQLNQLDAQLEQNFALSSTENLHQACIMVPKNQLTALMHYLHQSQVFDIDFLNCISAVDQLQEERFDVHYHLSSITKSHTIAIKVELPRNQASIPSISSVFKAAIWHEREAFDLFGIVFENHPDLRRILLPEDWEGFPLRKDYSPADTYRGIPITYQRNTDGK